MVEYGINVTNKFDFLSDDEMDDPEEMLRKAEALNKKEEKSASQKKADKNAAAKKKKETAAAAALKAAAQEAEAKKASQTTLPARKGGLSRENKENRPEGDRGRGRGRGTRGGAVNRGRGGFTSDVNRPPVDRPPADQIGVKDPIGERFGEGRGGRDRGRGRGGMRGRPSLRGGRGNFARPVDTIRENNFNAQQPLADENNTNHFGGERQNLNVRDGEIGDNHSRGGYRGGRGGDRPYRSGRGGGRGRQFDRFSGSVRTGMKSVDKKDGYGKGNWGTENDELMGAANGSPVNAIAENEKNEISVPPREKTEEELRVEAEEEALSKQLTLDEFKAQMAAKRSEPHFNLRRAGEGVNDNEYDSLVPLAKHTVEEAPEEEIVVVRREPRAKHLNIEINFTDEQRGGRNARMRDGFRSGRGSRGGGRDGRAPRTIQGFEVSADAFPALGSQ